MIEDDAVKTTGYKLDIDSLPASTRAAVSYLRVSTKEQAAGGGNDEGFSIPAQRLANQRKAASISAVIVAEFIDAGESARKADRPQLQALLEYVQNHPIAFCIVHKVDRLARNRVDDVEINVALTRAGVKLVSASENIDETPSGMLLHGIMSTIAEFYSRNLATEVSKGMTQKAVSGGTVARAPIGYRNVRKFDTLGREFRTVEVDDERAPHVRWAFETYASGDWSLSMLQQELATRGLRTRPTPKIPSKPLEIANLHKMLRNGYYVGEVTYRGTRYEGNHEQIIERGTWERVQTVLSAHNTAGDRQRVHEHYLKGSVFCGECGSRLMVTMARNAQGVTYDYFVCLGRHRKRTNCGRQAMRVDSVEAAVERAWGRLKLTYDERIAAKARITAELDQLAKREGRDRHDFEAQRDALLSERGKLLTAHYADAIPLDLLKLEQARISSSLEIVTDQLALMVGDQTSMLDNLDRLLALLQQCDVAYLAASPNARRLMNQAFAEKIYIDETGDGVIEAIQVVESVSNVVAVAARGRKVEIDEEPPPVLSSTLSIPIAHNTKFRSISASGFCVVASKRLFAARSLNKPFWVDPRGFELLVAATLCAMRYFALTYFW